MIEKLAIGKKLGLFLLAVLMGILLVLPQAAFAAGNGMRYTITVSKFENRSGWAGQWDIGDAYGSVMTDILNQTGRFIVLGEQDMRQAAMNEQDLASSGRTVQGSITPRTGQMTPAQLLVKGVITHVQDTSHTGGGIAIGGIVLGGGGSTAEINVTMYIVDSTTGQVLASTSIVGKSNSSSTLIGYAGHGWGGVYGNQQHSNLGKAIENAVAQGTQWMISQLPSLPWRGEVVMVNGDNIYVNRGMREGVQAGQVFIVGKAKIIRDPGTGEVLDETVYEIARIQVVEVKEKLSICQVISGDGGSIRRGLAIQLPPQ